MANVQYSTVLRDCTVLPQSTTVRSATLEGVEDCGGVDGGG